MPHPHVFLAGLFAAVLGVGCGESRPRPNVLLITVDTLRADHLGCYGYPLDTSPNLDRMAREGVRFTDCTVQFPKTWPSLASLMTGTYPRTNGIKAALKGMPPSFVTLGELFRDAGYRTAAVVGNFNAGRGLGFEQGFDLFVESWEKKWREERGDDCFRTGDHL